MNVCGFVSSAEVYRKLQAEFMRGAKVLHRVSLPVLRRTDDVASGYVLAAFAFIYTAEGLAKGVIPRPALWVTLDLATGEILERHNCHVQDFSDADFDARYDISAASSAKPSKELAAENFALLDKVREGLLCGTELDQPGYDEYLRGVLSTIPDSYQRFYRELSSV
ncbi:MAG: hypothetical protein LBR39_02190 [Coriobacteriales bacterium]|jgi:hypothetical protein|nr:hypothetical protein [Coriobacteriales bacterium]